MTQAQLSKAAKIHRITISKYEAGLVDPTLDSAEKLAAALGVTVDELIGKKAGRSDAGLTFHRVHHGALPDEAPSSGKADVQHARG